MKRFTETTKWDDPWYRNLTTTAKLLWSYLTDKCNCIGLVEIDLSGASFHIGTTVKEKHLTELESRLQRLPNGKVFITKFIPFQYGLLSVDCRAHKPIFAAIHQHQIITDGIGYQYPTNSLPVPSKTGKEQEQEQEEDPDPVRKGECKGENHYHSDSRTVLHILNESSGRHFRETDENLGFISARLREPDVNLAGVRLMIFRQCQRWKGTVQAEYLRPETLFNKTKFDGYYAAKDLPVENEHGTYHNNHQQNPRPLTGAEQRLVGHYPVKPTTLTTSQLIAKRQATRDALAAKEAESRRPAADGAANGHSG